MKSEKTERRRPSEESDPAQAGFLERWRLLSRSHGHLRGLKEMPSENNRQGPLEDPDFPPSGLRSTLLFVRTRVLKCNIKTR